MSSSSRDVDTATVLIPCLNEEDTIGACVSTAIAALSSAGVSGEVLVVDNGSTDASAEVARRAGARVLHVPERGYGAALMAGIAAARGAYVVMGDGDGSYDFREVPAFLERLRSGFDIVQGCRFAAGGGSIAPQAMPVLHRWLGNPALTMLARLMFRVPVRDVYCGLRGFRRDYLLTLDLRCTGMEFAIEMLIKAVLSGGRIGELPVTLHKDGRKRGRSHLRTFTDGSRSLRTYLLYSPKWLFLFPGLAVSILGLIGYALVYSDTSIGRVRLDAHTLLFASLAIILGAQASLFAVAAKIFAVGDGLLPIDRWTARLLRTLKPETGLALSAAPIGAGLTCLAVAVGRWRAVGFGDLDYSSTMRWVVPGVTLTALGFQFALASSFVALLLLRRRGAGLLDPSVDPPSDFERPPLDDRAAPLEAAAEEDRRQTWKAHRPSITNIRS